MEKNREKTEGIRAGMKSVDEMNAFIYKRYGNKTYENAIAYILNKPQERRFTEPVKTKIFMKQLEAAAARPIMRIDITLRSGVEEKQIEGIKIVTNQMKAARTADTEEQTLIQSAIAVGYANAMRNNDMLSSEELEGIINIITKAAEDNRKLLQDISRSSAKRSFWKKVTA